MLEYQEWLYLAYGLIKMHNKGEERERETETDWQKKKVRGREKKKERSKLAVNLTNDCN